MPKGTRIQPMYATPEGYDTGTVVGVVSPRFVQVKWDHHPEVLTERVSDLCRLGRSH